MSLHLMFGFIFISTEHLLIQKTHTPFLRGWTFDTIMAVSRRDMTAVQSARVSFRGNMFCVVLFEHLVVQS